MFKAIGRWFKAMGYLLTGQIDAARRLAGEEGLDVDFRVAPAEDVPFDAGTFDLATANQCLLYFDLGRLFPELRRVLAPDGRFGDE